MSRLEEMLREGLREVPDPPHVIEVSDVRERVLRKRRTLGAATTLVLVLALAVGLTVALTRGRPNPVPPTANRRPSALENVLWRDRITGSTLLVRNGTMQINIQCHPMTYLERSAGGIVHRGRMLVQGPSCGGPQDPPRRGYTREVARFAAVTAGPFGWSRNGSTLTVTRAGTGSIRLVAAARSEDPAGTTWRLESYEVGQALHAYRGTATLQLSGDPFTMAETCPWVDGRLTIGAGVLRFEPGPLESIACPVALAGPVLRAFSGWVSYRVAYDELFLSAGVRILLVFRKAAH